MPIRLDRNLGLALGVCLWVSAGVLVDRGASLATQHALGAATWLVLVLLLSREKQLVRAQVAAAVIIATAGELFLALGLELYTYRLGNLPLVPPGHGIVYLAALTLGRSRLFIDNRQTVVTITLLLAMSWAAWGVALAPRTDMFGAILALCFAGFVVAGRAPLVYAGAFLVTSWLEIAGTTAGTWTWAVADDSGLLTMGNPPSGIAGGYCLLDCAALSVGTRFTAWWKGRAIQGTEVRVAGDGMAA
jgi:hypothetical protein